MCAPTASIGWDSLPLITVHIRYANARWDPQDRPRMQNACKIVTLFQFSLRESDSPHLTDPIYIFLTFPVGVQSQTPLKLKLSFIHQNRIDLPKIERYFGMFSICRSLSTSVFLLFISNSRPILGFFVLYCLCVLRFLPLFLCVRSRSPLFGGNRDFRSQIQKSFHSQSLCLGRYDALFTFWLFDCLCCLLIISFRSMSCGVC